MYNDWKNNIKIRLKRTYDENYKRTLVLYKLVKKIYKLDVSKLLSEY